MSAHNQGPAVAAEASGLLAVARPRLGIDDDLDAAVLRLLEGLVHVRPVLELDLGGDDEAGSISPSSIRRTLSFSRWEKVARRSPFG